MSRSLFEFSIFYFFPLVLWFSLSNLMTNNSRMTFRHNTSPKSHSVAKSAMNAASQKHPPNFSAPVAHAVSSSIRC